MTSKMKEEVKQKKIEKVLEIIKKLSPVKVLDAQGKALEIYQGKTFEIQSNRLYVCPKGTEYCSSYVKAIVINSSYIIEPEN